MEFDKKSLLKLGKLARISISDDKLNNLSTDLNSILEFVDQLNFTWYLEDELISEMDSILIFLPDSGVYDLKLEVRDDKVDNKNSTEDVLENAPEKEMDFFVVPKVIE